MAEWPMSVTVVWNEQRGEYQDLQVIPADLGRELYEELSRLQGWLEGTGYDEPGSDLRVLLARYEREVGE